MKRVIAFILAAALIISLAACGIMSETENKPKTEVATEQPVGETTPELTTTPTPYATMASTPEPTSEPKDDFSTFSTDSSINGHANRGISVADGNMVYTRYWQLPGITVINLQTGEITTVKITSDLTRDTFVEDILCVYNGCIYFRASGRDFVEERDIRGEIMRIGIDGTGEETVFVPEGIKAYSGCTAYGPYILYNYQIGGTSTALRIDIETGESKHLTSLSSQTVALDGEHIFFEEFAGGTAPGICRSSMDGGSKKIIALDIQPVFIVPVGDWLYYTSSVSNPLMICRIKKDGSDQQELGFTHWIPQFNVAGDYIYYADPSDSRRLYRMKTDGTGKEKICDIKNIWKIGISAGRVFFEYTEREDGGKMYFASVLPDGSGLIEIDETLIQ